MNPYHQEILVKLKALESQPKSSFNLPHYFGTDRQLLYISVPETKQLAREFARHYPDLTIEELSDLLDSLYQGKSSEEICFGPKLLTRYFKLRKIIGLNRLKDWLGYTKGWAEVDSLCQSTFTAPELLARWEEWEKLIQELAGDPNVHRRRASLVLLTKPVGQSARLKLADLAFQNINLLKGEKDILITKAISWLLRSLIKNHRDRVAQYLEDNRDTLPKIALRETTRKLKTGKK